MVIFCDKYQILRISFAARAEVDPIFLLIMTKYEDNEDKKADTK